MAKLRRSKSQRLERKRILGTPVDVIAADDKRAHAPAGRHGPPVLLGEATIREMVLQGKCPWCGRGPFLVLAQHTVLTHGVGRRDLRNMAGMTIGESICDPEHSEQHRQLAHAQGSKPPRAAPGQDQRVFTEAGRQRQSDRARKVWAAKTEEQRRAFSLSGSMARKGKPQKPRQPCVICGVEIPYRSGNAARRVCSSECNKIRLSRQLAAQRATAKARVDAVRPVILLRLSEGIPQDKIAVEVGVSQRTVSRIKLAHR